MAEGLVELKSPGQARAGRRWIPSQALQVTQGQESVSFPPRGACVAIERKRAGQACGRRRMVSVYLLHSAEVDEGSGLAVLVSEFAQQLKGGMQAGSSHLILASEVLCIAEFAERDRLPKVIC